MTRRRTWTDADIDLLFELRDVQNRTWREIGEAIDDNFASCCTRYFYYKDKRLDAMRAGEAVAPRQPRKRQKQQSLAPSPPKKPRAAASLPVPKGESLIIVKHGPRIMRPRYIHEADMDIIARIDRQGLTSGFLGDPPPGRSALDQIRKLRPPPG